METITLEPTTEGYASMLDMFADSIIRDVKLARKVDSRHLMASVIEIASYLGSMHRGDLLVSLIERLRR